MVSLATSSNPQIPLYFNLDAAVGQGGSNSPVDVELVSFLFSRVASDPGRLADQREIFGKVRPSSTCSPELIAAINKLEEMLGYQRDGKVSVAKTSSGAFGPGHGYLICQLNYQVKKSNVRVWPRLDQVPGCPPGLAGKVRNLVCGTV